MPLARSQLRAVQTRGPHPHQAPALPHRRYRQLTDEWRTQLRIYHALVLLADGHDTTHVAHACGWANPSSFIAAFTQLIGTTPGRYRTGP
ncbi:helix-turn-helix domain-containing protein [Nocardia beijingensis]|uniref:helix-turn-helix domain-containing protein n=1 Tax=Nocardia beijingensis TaxID=95162 RepID=UPI003F4D559B